MIESCIAAVPAALLMAGFIVIQINGVSSVSNGSSGVFVCRVCFLFVYSLVSAPIIF